MSDDLRRAAPPPERLLAVALEAAAAHSAVVLFYAEVSGASSSNSTVKRGAVAHMLDLAVQVRHHSLNSCGRSGKPACPWCWLHLLRLPVKLPHVVMHAGPSRIRRLTWFMIHSSCTWKQYLQRRCQSSCLK